MKRITCPLYKNARDNGILPAIITEGRFINYRILNMLVNMAVKTLKKKGIKPSDRVGIYCGNSISYYILLLALWRMGAVACPVNTRLPVDAVNRQMKAIQAVMMVADLNIQFDLTTIHPNELNPTRDDDYKESDEDVEINLDQDTTIIFTSGSSSKPKAALHTYANHYFSALGANEHIDVSLDDRWFLTLPLYHMGGLSIIFRVLLGRSCMIIPATNDLARAIDQLQPTHISLVSTQLYRLIQNPAARASLRQFKAVLLGGSAIPPSLIQKSIESRIPVYATYGLTEMTSQLATSAKVTKDNPYPKAKILRYREVKISQNEILVKGKTLFKGYIKKQGQVELPLNKDGWFQTGDLGELTDDQHLIVKGRKDKMFISGGENIQPEEVEACLGQIKEIEEAVIVPIYNEVFGQRPAAFIKWGSSHILSDNDLTAYLLKYLPKFKVPIKFYPWPDKEQGNGIKISRKYLAELVG